MRCLIPAVTTVYNQILDGCLGHTGPGGAYHDHALLERCFYGELLEFDPSPKFLDMNLMASVYPNSDQLDLVSSHTQRLRELSLVMRLALIAIIPLSV